MEKICKNCTFSGHITDSTGTDLLCIPKDTFVEEDFSCNLFAKPHEFDKSESFDDRDSPLSEELEWYEGEFN